VPWWVWNSKEGDLDEGEELLVGAAVGALVGLELFTGAMVGPEGDLVGGTLLVGDKVGLLDNFAVGTAVGALLGDGVTPKGPWLNCTSQKESTTFFTTGVG